MSDTIIGDKREIRAAIRRGLVINADRICPVCCEVVATNTREPHRHARAKRPAESGSFHVGR